MRKAQLCDFYLPVPTIPHERVISSRWCARLWELVSSHGFGTRGGASRGLVLAIRIAWARLWLPPTILSDPKGSYYLVAGRFQFLPHTGRGSSTVTTRLERCASLGSMGNSCRTQYPPQSTWSSVVPRRETSHKSMVVKPVGPRLPLQRSEGKMPPPRGGQPRQLRSG
jgi:hypothetical protein